MALLRNEIDKRLIEITKQANALYNFLDPWMKNSKLATVRKRWLVNRKENRWNEILNN